MHKKLPPAVQPFLFNFSDITLSDIGGSVSSSTNADSSRASPESSRSPQSDRSDSPIPQERSTSEMQLVPFREEYPKLHQPQPTTTPIFSLPSLRFPSIPRQLHIPLQSSNPEHFQVSDTKSSGLDLSLCVFPFFAYSIQTSRGLIHFDQPPHGANTIETSWNLSHRFQARCYNTWRYLKCCCSSILYPRRGCARGNFLCWCQTPTHSGPTPRKAWSTGF